MINKPVVIISDLEGVIFPEFWIEVATITGIEKLKLTTRDISDYEQLMKMRITTLRENNIKYIDLIEIIKKIEPLEGAKEFINKIREKFQFIILSDTFYEFFMPIAYKLDYPTIFCNSLIIGEDGFIVDYVMRDQKGNGKQRAVRNLKDMGFYVISIGDSYNDTLMFKEADMAFFFNGSEKVMKEFPQYEGFYDYNKLYEKIVEIIEK